MPQKPELAVADAQLDRRRVLGLAAALPFSLGGGLASAQSQPPADAIPPRTKINFIWNPGSPCLVVVGLAQKQGIFAKHGLDVETLNVGSDTAAILEAVALGRADATTNFLLRFMKPLESGFDIKLTAGTHGGCSYLVVSRKAGISAIADLRGKRIGISDPASPTRFLYSILLKREGVDPMTEVSWIQYPPDLFPVAVQKGEIDAFVDVHPNVFFAIARSNGELFELASNGAGELGKRTCCALAISGRLLRENRAAATALTRAMIEASLLVDSDLDLATRTQMENTPSRGASFAEVKGMLATYPYDIHRGCPTGEEFLQQVTWYATELKNAGILKPSTDPVRFASKITLDVLSA